MDLDEVCTACCEDSPEDECSESERPCGHHCNHSWSHDQCCWCDKEWGEESQTIEAAPRDIKIPDMDGLMIEVKKQRNVPQEEPCQNGT